MGGETEYYSKSVLIDMRQSSVFRKSINFTIPKNIVEESEKIEVGTVGNLLGTSMIHLDNLIRLHQNNFHSSSKKYYKTNFQTDHWLRRAKSSAFYAKLGDFTVSKKYPATNTHHRK